MNTIIFLVITLVTFRSSFKKPAIRRRRHHNKDSDEDYKPSKIPRKRNRGTNDDHKPENETSFECSVKLELMCNICFVKFHHPEDMEDHMKFHTKLSKPGQRTWNCRKCPAQLTSRKALTAHNKTHKVPEPEPPTYKYDSNLELYVCNTCSAEFQEEEEAEKHVTSAHIETFSCDVCHERFSKPYPYACHVALHASDGYFRCPLCSYFTSRRTNLAIHINRVHHRKFYHYCKTCGKGFNDSSLFKEHENQHLGIKPFVCVVCNNSFGYSRYLHSHQVRYHTVPIDGQLQKNQCPICLRVFSKSLTLERHLQAKHLQKTPTPRIKRHLCDICGKGFATKEKINIHYRVHTGIKPYTCQYCSKSFIKRDYLIMHERVHTGEKPYECQYCGKCFNQGAPLRIHVRGHTGERPYVCPVCNNGFVSKGSLNTHRKACKGAN